jgi:predicted TIM-barrel fold metal-dependent hydrolase
MVTSNPSTQRPRVIAVEEAWACQEWFDAVAQYPLAQAETVERRFMGAVVGNEMFRRALADTQHRLDVMDEAGVDMHVMSIVAPGVQILTREHAARVAALTNDRLAEVVNQHPTRLAGLGTVAPQDPAAAAAEVRRVVGQLGLSGVLLNSHTNEEYLDHERYLPILEAVEESGAPLYIHPRTPNPKMAQPFEDYGLMGALYGFAADTGLHAARLIFSGVFDRFPRLKIVLGHMGEGLPYWLWRWDNMWATMQAAGVSRKLNMPDLQRKPSEYFASNFAITTSGMAWKPTFDFCKATVGIDNLVFAIDYPFENSRTFTSFLHGLELSPDEFTRLASRNAETLFRLPTA